MTDPERLKELANEHDGSPYPEDLEIAAALREYASLVRVLEHEHIHLQPTGEGDYVAGAWLPLTRKEIEALGDTPLAALVSLADALGGKEGERDV